MEEGPPGSAGALERSRLKEKREEEEGGREGGGRRERAIMRRYMSTTTDWMEQEMESSSRSVHVVLSHSASPWARRAGCCCW